MKTRKLIPVFLSGLLTSPLFAADSEKRPVPSPVPGQAARGIETHRKGDVVIQFARKDGTPVSDLKVVVTQRTHDFAFGNLIRPRHYTNEQYRGRFLEIFNFIQLLEFNWGQYERKEGKPQLAQRRAFIDGWCRTNGLTRFYGHMLTWSYQMDEPRNGPVNPFWLFRYDRDTQFRLLQHGQCPSPFEALFRTGCIGWIDAVSRVFLFRLDRDENLAATPLEPMAALPFVGQEVLQCNEEERPKPPALTPRFANKILFQQTREKLLRQILRVGI